MKYLITGFPGSGKSTVAHELKKLGYNAISTDEAPGASRFVDQITKEPVEVPKNASAEWKLKHYWAWNPEKIKQLLSSEDDVFICGLSNTQSEFYDLFDKIFVLIIDELTVINRLANRNTNDFGKHPKELKRLKKIRKQVQSDLLNNGISIAIDSSQNLPRVIDGILKNTK